MSDAPDSRWMARALALAAHGGAATRPNPQVGCVLVHDGEVVGEGWHARAGGPHAERVALQQAGAAATGSTAYVTLEPCSHHGRTPPCADALIEAGIVRVVVAMEDPNPLVAGAGMARLRAAGIAVECGLMGAAAEDLNTGFLSRMRRGRPWLRSKVGMSLDGRTALANGCSQWITGEAARRDVQHWRARACAVLTGIGTVLADDPLLNVREPGLELQPLRVVLDSALRMPATARMLHEKPGGGVLIYTASDDAGRRSALEAAGAEVCVLPSVGGQVDLSATLADLGRRGLNEVLVEAGATLNGALLKADLVDECLLYIAPQLLGDQARGIAQLGELTALNQAVQLAWQDVRRVGDDLRVLARVRT